MFAHSAARWQSHNLSAVSAVSADMAELSALAAFGAGGSGGTGGSSATAAEAAVNREGFVELGSEKIDFPVGKWKFFCGGPKLYGLMVRRM